MDAWASIASVAATFVGSSFVSLLLLRNKRKESDATVAKGLAEAEKIDADTEAVQVSTALEVNRGLREEIDRLRRERSEDIDRLKGELEDVRGQLSEAAEREWLCLENQNTLRRALLSAGISVPELLDVQAAHPPGEPPKRRRSDYITDEEQP